MAQWEGKSRGNVIGYKIYVFIIKNTNLYLSYFILRFVTFYFFLFSQEGTKASLYYFRERRGYSKLKSYLKVYQSYFKFGQTIVDKIAIRSGLRNRFTYEFDGVNHLKDLLRQKNGAILISAHVGNFEIADYFFNEIDFKSEINIVTTDQEHVAISSYLNSVASPSKAKFILVKEDLSHIFEINKALSDNELVCFTGDRYMEGTRFLEAELLGQSAKFPAGPFLLASRLNVPVAFVYVMKESAKHYHLYTRLAKAKARDANGLLQDYTESVEGILEKYPLQWFNYFKFWN